MTGQLTPNDVVTNLGTGAEVIVDEQWLEIPASPGYEVSDQGRVRSPRRILRPWPDRPNGRLLVRIGSRNYAISRLVLGTFVGPCPSGMEARHLNDVKTDNRLVNLAWGSKSANSYDAVRNGVHPQARKTQCDNGHELDAANTAYDSQGWRHCRECARKYRREWWRRQSGFYTKAPR